MTLWKPAPVHRSARKLYLRVYISIPTSFAQKIAGESLFASMDIDEVASQEVAADGMRVEEFIVLKAVLRDCCYLEDLMVEMVVRRQETMIGQGLESLDFDQDTRGCGWIGYCGDGARDSKAPTSAKVCCCCGRGDKIHATAYWPTVDASVSDTIVCTYVPRLRPSRNYLR